MIKATEAIGRVTIGNTSYPVVETARDARVVRAIDYELEHGRTSKRTRLIGTMHMANPEFYDDLKDDIDSSGTPLLEWIHLEDRESLKDPMVRMVTSVLRSTKRILQTTTEETRYDVVEQRNWQLEHFPGISADISTEEFAQELLNRGCDIAALRSNFTIAARFSRDRMRRNAVHADRQIETLLSSSRHSRFIRFVQLVTRLNETRSAFQEVVNDVRNNRLFRTIQEHRHEHTIVPWGALHIAPLHHRLTDSCHWHPDPHSVQYRTVIDGTRLKQS